RRGGPMPTARAAPRKTPRPALRRPSRHVPRGPSGWSATAGAPAARPRPSAGGRPRRGPGTLRPRRPRARRYRQSPRLSWAQDTLRSVMGAQWKHRIKQASALARTRVLGKLSKEIILAARGGADPALNARLRVAVDAAKKASMPRETLERAIKKGAGLLDEPASFELVTYEGFAPHQVPVIVECLTDNKNRTQQTIR